MKRNGILTLPVSVVLSFLLSVSAINCMITGFRLEVNDLSQVMQVCFAVSLTVSLLLLWKWGGWATAVLLTLLAGFLWYRGVPEKPFLSLITGISRTYHNAYNWGYLYLATPGMAADWPMAALGGILALSAARTLTRGKDTWLTVLLCALPLASCLVVTDTVPDSRWLFVLMAGLILLLLTANLRSENPHQGNRLTLLAAIPVVLALGLLFRMAPQEGYVNHSEEIQNKVFSLLQQLPQKVQTANPVVSSGAVGSEPNNVDLKSLGPRAQYSNVVMEVTADTGGILYLRGQDYDLYDGTGWTASAHRAEPFLCDGNSAGDVTIRTRGRQELLYLPYYPREGVTLVGGSLKNTDRVKEYTFPRIVPPEGELRDPQPVEQDADILVIPNLEAAAFGSTAERLRYLTLPGQTKLEAQALLESLLSADASRREQAEAIAQYVRNSAEYDLNTPKMAENSEDFALWFLEESETGYCVHFATAAVVLLRAADIPARYVTGYMVTVQDGRTVKVTGGNAHAWAEYFDPQLGTWVILEATPALSPAVPTLPETQSPETRPSESTPTETFGQIPTEAPTEVPLPDSTLPQAAPEKSNGKFPVGWLLLLAAVAAVLLQRAARLALRRRRFQAEGTNAQALARWQEVQRLARLLGEAPPEELLNLALKAKFSQHTLSSEELQQFDGYLTHCHRRMRKQPWYWQILYRCLWVVY